MELSLEKHLLGRRVQAAKKHWSRHLMCLLPLIFFMTFIVPSIIDFEKITNSGYSIESDRGVVASDDGRCSQIGVSMLAQGGHAVDAAVAVTLCLGVLNACESGIGGGSFMIVRSSSTSHTQAFNMRETAPFASSKDMYENNTKAKSRGALSIAVPGELAGLRKAWCKYGRLPWKTLFEPSIKLAKEGFIVGPYLGSVIASNAEKITADPGLSSVFAPNGTFLEVGDICFNKELGRTLEAVAEHGLEVFYEGEIGEKLVKDVKDAGGILTMEDLRNYTVDVPDPVTVNAMGYTVLGLPPPSTGTVSLSLVLNIFQSYGNATTAAKGALGLHRLIEALKHMMGIRMYLGDPKFVNITSIVSKMLSPSYGEKIQHKINDNGTFPPQYYIYGHHILNPLSDHGTSHLCIVDEDRNAVSLTTSVNDYFGSGFLSPSTGIILNNQMDDFSMPTDISNKTLPPAPNNFIEPRKRPVSSMTPIIVLKDGELIGVTGASGGLFIIPAVVQVFFNHFILGMKPLAAVQSPRIYHKLIPNFVSYEDWTLVDGDHIEISDHKKIFLLERGHKLLPDSWGATCQMIVQNLKDDGVNMGRKQGKDSNQTFPRKLTVVTDPRKDAKPAGLRRDHFLQLCLQRIIGK